MENKTYRIYLEIDTDDDIIETNGRLVCLLNNIDVDQKDTIFDEIICEAGSSIAEVWEAVQKADEIYCSTSLIPQYTTIDSPTLFNNLLYQAHKAELKNKKVFIMRRMNSIWWEKLRLDLLDVFDVNELYCFSDASEELEWEKISKEQLEELIKNRS